MAETSESDWIPGSLRTHLLLLPAVCHKPPSQPSVWPPEAQAQAEQTSGEALLVSISEDSDSLIYLLRQRIRFTSHRSGQLTRGALLTDPDSSSRHETASKLCAKFPAGSSSPETGRGGPAVAPSMFCFVLFSETPLRTSSEPSTVLGIEDEVLSYMMILFF